MISPPSSSDDEHDFIRKSWEDPLPVYVLNQLLHHWNPRTTNRSLCTPSIRRRFAVAIHQAWFLLNDDAQEIVRSTLLYSRKRRDRIRAINGLSYDVLNTCQGFFLLLCENVPEKKVFLVRNRLHALKDRYVSSIEEKRKRLLHTFETRILIDADIMYGLLGEIKWNKNILCNGHHMEASKHMKEIIEDSNNFAQLQMAWEYLGLK